MVYWKSQFTGFGLLFFQIFIYIFIYHFQENNMISFNVPPFVGTELTYVKQAIDAHKICGDGQFTKKCHAWLEERFGARGSFDHQRDDRAGNGRPALRTAQGR